MSFVSRIIEDITAGVTAHIDPQKRKEGGYFKGLHSSYTRAFGRGYAEGKGFRAEMGLPTKVFKPGDKPKRSKKGSRAGGRRSSDRPTPAKPTPAKPASTKPAKPSRVRAPRKPRLVTTDERPEKKDEPQRIAASYKDLANKLLDVINDAN